MSSEADRRDLVGGVFFIVVTFSPRRWTRTENTDHAFDALDRAYQCAFCNWTRPCACPTQIEDSLWCISLSIEGRNGVAHPQAQDDPFLQDLTKFLPAGFQRVGLRPDALQSLDFGAIAFAFRQELVVGLSQRGVEISGQHACLASPRPVHVGFGSHSSILSWHSIRMSLEGQL